MQGVKHEQERQREKCADPAASVVPGKPRSGQDGASAFTGRPLLRRQGGGKVKKGPVDWSKYEEKTIRDNERMRKAREEEDEGKVFAIAYQWSLRQRGAGASRKGRMDKDIGNDG